VLNVEDWAEIRRLRRWSGCRFRRSRGCWGFLGTRGAALALKRFNETANRPYTLSASIGQIAASPSALGDLDELLASADERTYEEKGTLHAYVR
jgi:GGDEF domain-containing protein